MTDVDVHAVLRDARARITALEDENRALTTQFEERKQSFESYRAEAEARIAALEAELDGIDPEQLMDGVKALDEKLRERPGARG